MKLQLAFLVVIAASAMQSIAFSPQNLVYAQRRSSALQMANPSQSVFLTPETAKECIELAGSPLYAYSLERLDQFSDNCLAFPNAYGLTVRYAMKALPNQAILKFLNSKNIHIDASSGFECRRAMDAGIPADHISLSSQELPSDFAELIDMGVKINCW